jgi:hypothetical protein
MATVAVKQLIILAAAMPVQVTVTLVTAAVVLQIQAVVAVMADLVTDQADLASLL